MGRPAKKITWISATFRVDEKMMIQIKRLIKKRGIKSLSAYYTGLIRQDVKAFEEAEGKRTAA